MSAHDKPIIEIDGMKIQDLDGFYEAFSKAALGDIFWGRNLDAFNDVLRGGFGTPEGGFVLRWKNAAVSKKRLGHEETARVLQARLKHCHPSNIPRVQAELDAAKRGEGTTVFDTLIEIIREHGPGGAEFEDGIELVLE